MGDEREFKIKITTSADRSGAQQVAADLDNLSPKTKEYIKSLKAGGEASEKMNLSHRELHVALGMLGPEFAHIGGIAQYALHNQILAPVLGIVGAFALWQHRINSCVEALAGVELPDNVKQQVGQIGALAESWRVFNNALLDAADGYSSVDEASKRNIETLKAEEEQKKKLLEADKKLELSELERQKALLSVAEYEARKAEIENRYEGKAAEESDEAQLKRLQEKADRGAALAESAKRKMAEAGRIKLGTPEQEASIDEQMRTDKEAAEKSAKEHQDRLNDLYAQKDHLGSPLEQLARFARLVGRYGLPGAEDEGLDESIALEKSGAQSDQTIIDRYNQRMKGKAGRDELLERRKKLVAEAGKEAGESARIWEEGPGDVAAYQRGLDNRRAVAATNQQTQRNTADAKMLESPEGNLLRDVAEAERILQSGGQISLKQQSEIKTAVAMLAQTYGDQANTIIQGLGSLRGDVGVLAQRLAGVVQTIQAQSKQIRNLAGPP
jgi:hypothetical protein